MIGVTPSPPGVAPNFIDPESQAQTNLVLLTLFLTLTTLFIIMRIYTRMFITRWLSLDDCKSPFPRALDLVDDLQTCVFLHM